MKRDAEQPLGATIVDKPRPDASGYVIFRVEVADHVVEVYAEPCGVGSAGLPKDLERENQANGAVWRFLREHRDEKLSWYREAARLRRAAGNPPLIQPAPCHRLRFAGEPMSHGDHITYRVLGAAVELRVFIWNNGGVMDDCDDWVAVTDDDRTAAMASALHDVFEHPERARALGLDVDLLAEFYR